MQRQQISSFVEGFLQRDDTSSDHLTELMSNLRRMGRLPFLPARAGVASRQRNPHRPDGAPPARTKGAPRRLEDPY